MFEVSSISVLVSGRSQVGIVLNLLLMLVGLVFGYVVLKFGYSSVLVIVLLFWLFSYGSANWWA